MIIIKGFCGIIFQTVLLREFFSVFYGCELSFVFTISFWIIGAGAGSYFLRKIKRHYFIYNFLTIFENIFFIGAVFFLRSLRHISNFQFLQSFFIFSFLIIFTSGFLEGSRFVLLSSLFFRDKSSGRIYALEGIGALTGGILLPFFLRFTPFLIIFISSFINLFTFMNKRKHKMAFSLLTIIFIFSSSLSPFLEKKSLNLKWTPFKIVKSIYTPYQNIEIVEKQNELVLSSNGFPEVSNQPDYYSLKNIVFFSIYPLKKVKNVLILSNPELIEEMEKYRPEKIYYVEIDPEKINTIKKYFLKKNYKNLVFVKEDPYLFLKKTKMEFDVIFAGKVMPLSFRENRKFTSSSVSLLSKKTKIVSLILPGNYDYVGKETSFIHSIVFNTFRKQFKYHKFVFAYPFISIYSNVPFKDINKNLIIDKDFFNPYYLKYTLNEKKDVQYIKKNIEKTQENTVNNQILLFTSISRFISLSNQKTGSFLFHSFKKISGNKTLTGYVFVFLFLLFFLISKKNIYTGIILTNGVVCFGFELLIIILFQILFGYIYSKISILIALFMAGISTGGLISITFLRKKYLFYSEFLQFFFYTFSFMIIYFLKEIPSFLFFISIFLSGFFVGIEFGIISGLLKERFVEKTGKLYAIDLAGGVVSSLVIPFIILPLAGIYTSFILFPVLKFSNLISGPGSSDKG